ncbi:hypothetical protein A2773_03450 [Candidatus Gottesmanbacteria bacterium RIFCSPHIGHO2_01_FULL_39_10]|uniref:Uncharacterized protein n=1 Tax=Candidatus Gottesmanbacteria bacterium RIFCSPHIGHO2_01_FULL_39_10 TaxID=1798375 RepID=A0A1F5ZPF9_9BACT|nr:MAG: hypothetical protein A2773_03450 [Candidatus Gottesmanbacteria bacterium RIFCSPHIGHO2_01_FULL_39_10]
MTIHQLAKQLNISPEKLEKESLRAFLLTRLGEVEAKRHKILKRYIVESASDWDDKAKAGKRREEGYQGVVDYFNLDSLDADKEEIVKQLLSFS